jgi:hypothetical protein
VLSIVLRTDNIGRAWGEVWGEIVGVLWLLVSVGLLLGLGLGAAEVRRLGRMPIDTRLRGRGYAWTAVVLGLFELLGAGALLFFAAAFSRGRQIRTRGAVVLPPVTAGATWSAVGPQAAPIDAALDDVTRAQLAAQWRENGRTEHASVAAFARLTLDLMELGAPPKLLADAQRDALDEIAHTELCFALARELDGQALSPGPFPRAQPGATLSLGRTVALARLAVDSLVDGALHEGLSARVVAQLAQAHPHPRVQSMLRTIAGDEGRHAAHGWDVLAWCVHEGGDAVRAAVRGALTRLPHDITPSTALAARDGAWERWGIPGLAREQAAHRALRAQVVARVEALLDVNDGCTDVTTARAA